MAKTETAVFSHVPRLPGKPACTRVCVGGGESVQWTLLISSQAGRGVRRPELALCPSPNSVTGQAPLHDAAPEAGSSPLSRVTAGSMGEAL